MCGLSAAGGTLAYWVWDACGTNLCRLHAIARSKSDQSTISPAARRPRQLHCGLCTRARASQADINHADADDSDERQGGGLDYGLDAAEGGVRARHRAAHRSGRGAPRPVGHTGPHAVHYTPHTVRLPSAHC